MIHEADAHPGLANRIAVRLGARPAVTLPGTALPGAVVTGNPIRPAIAAVERAPVAPPLVAVVGGSLGARSLNRAVLGLYDRWRHRTDVTIHHVSGTRDYKECGATLDATRAAGDALDYRLVPFEEHMETIYTDATVIVARAGGMTAELTAVGIPSVLVPLPGAPGDHQTRNAEALVAAGAAVMIVDAALDAARLDAELDRAPRRSRAPRRHGCRRARPRSPRRHRPLRRPGRGGRGWRLSPAPCPNGKPAPCPNGKPAPCPNGKPAPCPNGKSWT